MDEVAQWPAGDRANLFNEVGARRGLDPGIIEKDFWVCWTLKRLFDPPDTGPALIFKGGTSLSKVFGAIRRFSEDIDLSFDRAALGFEGDRDPAKAASRKKADRLIEEIDAEVTGYIARRFLPRLNDLFAAALGPGLTGWSVAIGGAKGHDVEFQYPQSLETSDYGRLDYVRAVVRLELGARGDPWPASQREVRSYAAEEFPDQFRAPACTVTALEAERTFWEKATLLHAEAHRPPDKASDRHLSRHYYDLALLADTEHGKTAVKRLDLLEAVARHKSVFYRSGRASYETAKPGSLRLSPPEGHLASLRADYAKMRPMFFDEPPRFERLIERIRALEAEINSASR